MPGQKSGSPQILQTFAFFYQSLENLNFQNITKIKRVAESTQIEITTDDELNHRVNCFQCHEATTTQIPATTTAVPIPITEKVAESNSNGFLSNPVIQYLIITSIIVLTQISGVILYWCWRKCCREKSPTPIQPANPVPDEGLVRAPPAPLKGRTFHAEGNLFSASSRGVRFYGGINGGSPKCP